MVPPADIDGESTVSAIEPVNQNNQQQTATYAAPDNPVSDAAENTDVLNTPNLADTGSKPEPKIDQEPVVDQSQTSQLPDNSVNADNQQAVAPTGLAEEEKINIAEGDTTEPVVDGIGTDNPVAVNQSTPVEIQQDAVAGADELAPPVRKMKTEKDTEVAFLPRFSDPMQVPESYGGMSAADKACRLDLENMGVRFKELAPISDGPNCGIAHPIEVYGLSGGINIQPAATLNCNMTREFARWVKNELVPSARFRYFSGINTIRQMSSYSCRKMNSISENPWSEHARGNAIDVGTFVLNSGKEIDVEKKSIFSFRENGLLKAVRLDSCKYFNTVLGPGYPHHDNHFHFDLRSRRSGRRYCS
jgi:hypothetical protein